MAASMAEVAFRGKRWMAQAQTPSEAPGNSPRSR